MLSARRIVLASCALISAAVILSSCTKEDEPLFRKITYTACGNSHSTITYYDGDYQEKQIDGCFSVSVMLEEGETAEITGYSGDSDPFVMAILENDTTRCHIKCGKEETVSLKLAI
jgi:hypothetical protein